MIENLPADVRLMDVRATDKTHSEIHKSPTHTYRVTLHYDASYAMQCYRKAEVLNAHREWTSLIHEDATRIDWAHELGGEGRDWNKIQREPAARMSLSLLLSAINIMES